MPDSQTNPHDAYVNDVFGVNPASFANLSGDAAGSADTSSGQYSQPGANGGGILYDSVSSAVGNAIDTATDLGTRFIQAEERGANNIYNSVSGAFEKALDTGMQLGNEALQAAEKIGAAAWSGAQQIGSAIGDAAGGVGQAFGLDSGAATAGGASGADAPPDSSGFAGTADADAPDPSINAASIAGDMASAAEAQGTTRSNTESMPDGSPSTPDESPLDWAGAAATIDAGNARGMIEQMGGPEVLAPFGETTGPLPNQGQPSLQETEAAAPDDSPTQAASASGEVPFDTASQAAGPMEAPTGG